MSNTEKSPAPQTDEARKAELAQKDKIAETAKKA